MKVGIAQINPIIGAFSYNADKIITEYHNLVKSGAEVVILGELALPGYIPKDIIFRKQFLKDQNEAIKDIAAQTGNVPLIFGCITENPKTTGRRFYNSAAWCCEGKVEHYAHKCLLASYDVFDEDRYFEPASSPTVVNYKDKKIGITICEDIWTKRESAQFNHHKPYPVDPIDLLQEEKIDLMLNLSASPWYAHKDQDREHLVTEISKRLKCPIVYCNLVGGNDDILFDGRSIATNKEGLAIKTMHAFSEDSEIVETSIHSAEKKEAVKPMTEIHNALIMGIRDYAQKTGLTKAVLGLSGGIDSAIVAYLASQALGKDNVISFGLPSIYSSEHSLSDAANLAQNLGIAFTAIPIKGIVSSAEDALGSVLSSDSKNTVSENIQARSRALILTAIANEHNALLLTTGNKSELAVGYCTLYGDMCGGLSPLGDLYKTQVYELAKYINRDQEIIPSHILTKPPSAELSPDQKDEDTLGSYDGLDLELKRYIEKGVALQTPVTPAEKSIRRIANNEFKRQQSPPILKISPIAFGSGRRYPIAQHYK